MAPEHRDGKDRYFYITFFNSFSFKHASPDVERLLVGNKADMESRRVVPKERGEQLGQQQNIPFLETSAKTNNNIDEAFETLARLILKKVRGSVKF